MSDSTSDARFLRDIDQFLAETGMSRTGFGKAVAGDVHFYRTIAGGRSVSLRLYDRVQAFMATTRRFGEESRAGTGAEGTGAPRSAQEINIPAGE